MCTTSLQIKCLYCFCMLPLNVLGSVDVYILSIGFYCFCEQNVGIVHNVSVMPVLEFALYRRCFCSEHQMILRLISPGDPLTEYYVVLLLDVPRQVMQQALSRTGVFMAPIAMLFNVFRASCYIGRTGLTVNNVKKTESLAIFICPIYTSLQ